MLRQNYPAFNSLWLICFRKKNDFDQGEAAMAVKV